MTNTDDRIAEALDADDKDFLASLESDRGLFQQLGDSWQGPMGGWAKLVFTFAVVFGLLFVFCLYKVFTTTNAVEHTLWAISALAVLVIQGFTKDWIFSRMNMLTILREVKRLQVQVALLSEKQD